MSEANSSTQVEYRPIQGFPGYRVGSDGTVWSAWRRDTKPGVKGISGSLIGDTWKLLRCRKQKDGRPRVTLCNGRIRRQASVYVLVLEAFVGPRPNGMQACHFPDRNPANCALNNLRWDTPKNNKADQEFHGTVCRGEKNGFHKLTWDLVEQIRSRKKAGERSVDLASEFQVDVSQIRNIVAGRQWHHGRHSVDVQHARDFVRSESYTQCYLPGMGGERP